MLPFIKTQVTTLSLSRSIESCERNHISQQVVVAIINSEVADHVNSSILDWNYTYIVYEHTKTQPLKKYTWILMQTKSKP